MLFPQIIIIDVSQQHGDNFRCLKQVELSVDIQRHMAEQTKYTQIRHCRMQHLISVYTASDTLQHAEAQIVHYVNKPIQLYRKFHL